MVQMSGRSSGSSSRNQEGQEETGLEFPTILSCTDILQPLFHPVKIGASLTPKPNSKVWKWHCNICSKKFREIPILQIHMMDHEDEFPFQCDICFSRYRVRRALARHVTLSHLTEEVETFTGQTEGGSGIPPLEIPPIPLNQIKVEGKGRKPGSVTTTIPSFTSPEFPRRSTPKPRSKRRLSSAELTNCYRCQIVFPTLEDWRQHAVYSHALVNNPCPIVEMNYVDVQTIMKATKPSIITSNRNTPNGKVPESIRLVFSREKGNYVLKKSVSLEEQLDSPPESSLPELTPEVTLPDPTFVSENSSGNPSHESLLEETLDNDVASAPQVVSPSLNKENVPGAEGAEPSYVTGKQQRTQEVLGNGAANTGTQVGSWNSKPESLGSSGRIGCEAVEEDKGRLETETPTSPIGTNKRKRIPSESCSDLNKDSVVANSPESILPNFFNEVEHTIMISEEIRNPPIPASQIVNLAFATSLSGETTIRRASNDGQLNISLTVEESSGGSRRDSNPTITAEVPRTSPRYETISPPLRIPLPTDKDGATQLVLELEGTEITEVVEKEDESNDNNNNDKEEADRLIDDDFLCRVCQQVFLSEKELEVHFSESHFRIGGGNGSAILEPESPAPPTPAPPTPAPPIVSEARTLVHRRSLDDHPVPFPHRPTLQPRAPFPLADSALARQLQQDHRQPPTAVYRGPSIVNRPYLQPIQPGRPPMSIANGPHNITTGLNIMHHNGNSVSSSGMHRPPLSSAPTNYTMSQSTNSRFNSTMSHGPSRPSLTMRHPSSQSQSLQQQQLQHQNQFLRTMSQQSQYIAQIQAQARQQQQQLMFQPPPNNNNNNANNALHNALSSRPMPLNGIRHNSLESDGPRIVDVTSMARQQQQQQQQRDHINQLIANRLPGPGRPQDMQSHFRLSSSNGRGGMFVPPIRQEIPPQQQQQQKRPGPSMPSLLDHATPSKQPRIDTVTGNYGGSSRSSSSSSSNSPDMAVAVAQAQQRYSPQGVLQSNPNSSPTPNVVSLQLPLDRNLANAIGTQNGVNSLRLGNSISLTVCSTEDPLRVSPALQTSPGSRAMALNANSVASALANRGVTVTPASPPISSDSRNPQQLPPPSVSISPNPDNRASPVSVITRVERPSSVFHPPGAPPTSNHQFAMPRNPPPKGQSPVVVNSHTDRPDRPPTVDLTMSEEDSILSMTRSGFSIGRPVDRERRPAVPTVTLGQATQQQREALTANRSVRPPAIACNLCGVLFTSHHSLEEHKFSSHGIPVQSRVNGVQPNFQQQTRGMTPPGPARPSPPHLQQVRPQSPTSNRGTVPTPTNSRYLYIPLIDMSRMDPAKLRRLEDLGISSVVPLHGNERAAGQMGIPIMSLRADGTIPNMPWDSVLPVGPRSSPAQVAANAAVLLSQQRAREGENS